MVSNVCSICKGLWRCICGISESLGDNGIVPPSTDIRLMGPGSGTVTTLRGPAFRQPLEAPVVAGRWRPGREFPRADSADFRDRFTQTRGRGRCTFDEEPVVTECQPESQPPGNPSPGHPPDNQLPWYAQKRILIPTGAIAVVLVAVIAAIAGSTGEPVDGTPTPVAVASEEAGVEAADEQASADTAEQAAADEAAAIEEGQPRRLRPRRRKPRRRRSGPPRRKSNAPPRRSNGPPRRSSGPPRRSNGPPRRRLSRRPRVRMPPLARSPSAMP